MIFLKHKLGKLYETQDLTYLVFPTKQTALAEISRSSVDGFRASAADRRVIDFWCSVMAGVRYAEPLSLFVLLSVIPQFEHKPHVMEVVFPSKNIAGWILVHHDRLPTLVEFKP